MKINIAIVFTQRLECLNVLLDVLKNNFRKDYVTHVFCNLGQQDFESHKNFIDFSLIDYFHHFPDNCSLDQKTYESSVNREKYKRIQPMTLFQNAMNVMSNKKIESFVYTECDVFPLDEEKYTIYLEKSLLDKSLYCYYSDKARSTKTPRGMIVPSPLYMTRDIANTFFQGRSLSYSNMLSFEGRLMLLAEETKIPLKHINYYFPNNIEFSKNRTKETETTHQHNVFNLRKTFLERGITKGKWIEKIMSDDSMEEFCSHTKMCYDENFRLSYFNV